MPHIHSPYSVSDREEKLDNIRQTLTTTYFIGTKWSFALISSLQKREFKEHLLLKLVCVAPLTIISCFLCSRLIAWDKWSCQQVQYTYTGNMFYPSGGWERQSTSDGLQAHHEYQGLWDIRSMRKHQPLCNTTNVFSCARNWGQVLMHLILGADFGSVTVGRKTCW